jgi:hypothetical protein
MDFGVCLARTFRMAPGIEAVSVRNLRMVRCLLIRAGLMKLRRFEMMVRRLIVVFCGSVMMFDCLFNLWHFPSRWIFLIDF